MILSEYVRKTSRYLSVYIGPCHHHLKHVSCVTCLRSSSESVKQRTNIFYLLPERSCVPNSPLWFSSTPLDDSTLDTMLIRILTVRDLHLRSRTASGTRLRASEDPTLSPDEDEEEDDEDSE